MKPCIITKWKLQIDCLTTAISLYILLLSRQTTRKEDKMNIRFEAVNFLDGSSNEYDFDNARYLCTIEHADYTEYAKLLYLMQQHDKSEYGNICASSVFKPNKQ